MDRNALKLKVILCYTIVSLLIISCSNSELNSKYGVSFNTERNKIGLPDLDSSWTYNKISGSDGGYWINPCHETGIPYHFKKSISCNNDTIIRETNTYIGPHKYTTIDGEFEEELYITYYFNDNRWEYLWRKGIPSDNSRRYDEIDDEITSTEADSLLTLWKLKIN